MFCPLRLFCAIAIADCLLFAAAPAFAADQAERIDKLIDALASPNPKPEEVNQKLHSLATNYDTAAQAKVFAAYEALLAEEETAFPQLTSHLFDKRYCASIASVPAGNATSVNPANAWNVDVGWMCGLIIRSHITVHLEDWPAGLGTNRPGELTDDRHKLQSWLANQQPRKLWEMQLQAVESARFEMMEWEPELLVRNTPGDPAKVVAALADSNKHLKTLGEQLRTTKVPARPRGLFVADAGKRRYRMLGLPAQLSPQPTPKPTDAFRPRNPTR